MRHHHWIFDRSRCDDDRQERGWGHRGRHHGHHGFDEASDEIRMGGRGGGFGPRGPGLFERGRRGGREEFGRGGGGRVFGPGDLRSLLLWLIGEKPRHGYELIKAVEELVGGAYSPSPGSVYPILSLLEDMGQIEAASAEGGKKLFAITEAGRQALKDDAAAIDGLLSRLRILARSMGGMRPSEQVMQAVQTLKMALKMHRRGWSDEESKRVSSILTRAIAEIEGDDDAAT
ncbi:helix-turn-helix transcriptional regulator [Bradyrhizobium sp. 83012]|uniref:Helix-turn-helix transcriptional regulator n=1 Tax=Bradyrhizobium aeschynomenes TaxID=2734909 RepID=A0ABX2CGF8_9BRAD|nr:PadR family transcriptional regulator [Bradyrhizobium aeschynomenes]NPU66760.1 helix-turn-helix transcriptional regulator [Bradyrhizobium aeschynomenes]